MYVPGSSLPLSTYLQFTVSENIHADPRKGGGGEHGFFFCNHTTAASVETLSTLEKKLFETPSPQGHKILTCS